MLMPWDMTVALLEQCFWQRSVSFIHSVSAGKHRHLRNEYVAHTDNSVAEEQNPHFVCFCARFHLACSLPVNITSPPKDPVSFPGMFTVLI